jgi:hypothetical protein
MQRPASEVRKDRVKRTPTERRLRRDADQAYFDFAAKGELEKLTATQPPLMTPPAGWVVAPINDERKAKRVKKKRKRSATQ